MTEKMTIDEIGHLFELRMRLGLDEKDSSRDDYIINLDPFERVAMLAGWNFGDPTWADTFKEWLESQGLYVTTNPDADGVIE